MGFSWSPLLKLLELRIGEIHILIVDTRNI